MTLSLLIKSNLINDSTNIIIKKPLLGGIFTIQKGNWFQDNILSMKDEEIRSMTWEDIGKVTVNLK